MRSLPPPLLYFLAQFFVYIRQPDRALAAFEALFDRDPGRARAWSTAGFLYAAKENFSGAIEAFERAVALEPKDAATLFNLGFALQRVGRHEEALRRFEQAVAIQPNLDRAWYGMGVSLIHGGRFHEAIAKLTQAARLQPLNPFPRYQLAAAWFKLGEHEKVRAEYRHVKSFDPTIAKHISEDFGVPKDPD
jgi:tetratricopeptide (TPR) repeat protein